MNQPRSINSTKPFAATAREYVDKGWGVVPLPERRKEHPPTGFTGRAGKFADEDNLRDWLNPNGMYVKANIALRVGNMLTVNGLRYEVIGIDVDAHSGKHGAKELSALEKKLGKLPPTWTSSSRNDAVSGIRFYLVPYGYGFRGKASDSIDIVQRVHRYAVVYPSWHPDTKGQYFWYEPGILPDGQHVSPDIPDASNLPVLLDEWVDYLTAGKQLDDAGYGIDLDISNDDLKAWVRKHFNPPLVDEAGGMCTRMKAAVAHHISAIESSPSNHDKITNAHWNVMCVASEGHSGYESAIKEIESVWIKDIMAKGKRPLHMVQREMQRSLWGTFRKLKAKADSFAEQGISLFMDELCMTVDDLPPKHQEQSKANGGDGEGVDEPPPWIYSIAFAEKEFDPRDYDCNDVSQAHHFVARIGDSVRYLADYNGYIVYDEKTWHIDDFKLVRDLFDRVCVQTSKRRGYSLMKKLAKHVAQGGTEKDSVGAPLKRDMAKLLKVADVYRNDGKIKAMLECFKSVPGVAMRYNELNWDTSILAMPNGKVLKLDEPTSKPVPTAKGFSVVDNAKEYFTTMSTAVELVGSKRIPPGELALWNGYLDLFLPDKSYRAFVQKALGYLLIGGNPEKLAIFLVGIRNTGKTTMINAVQGAMADYGATFQPSAVFKDSNTGNNPELGNLLHKRGIFSSESGSQRIYANPFKRNTGGDKISVTRKYANNQIIGIPHFVPVVATNQAPAIDDADEALVKRILVLPFDIAVDDSHNDKRADVTIPLHARHAILKWLVLGYRRYVREGLSYSDWPDNVKLAAQEFAAEFSDVSTFLNEVCTAASDDVRSELNRDVIDTEHEVLRKGWTRVTASKLYDAYLREVNETNQKPMPKGRFGKKVKQVFGVDSLVTSIDNKSVRYYVGLKWRDESAMNQISG